MEKLLSNKTWPTLKRLSKSAKRVQAAIAYFTATENLQFHKGDLLIVDASDAAIRNRQTSARVLWKLRKKVRLFTLTNLHAKIVVVDDKLVIGSANASSSSAKRLYEAALLTDSPAIVSQAQSYLHQLASLAKPLNEKDLEALMKIKVQPPHFVSGGRRKELDVDGEKTWIVSATDIADDAYPTERKMEARGTKRVVQKHGVQEPSWLRWTGTVR